MKKFEFFINEKKLNLFNVIKNLRVSLHLRENLHPTGSTLNVMVLKIDAEEMDRRFHWNVGRDEVICVLDGEVSIEQKIDGQIISSLVSGSKDLFFIIAANVPHRITSITPYTYILEIIGGKFEQGATQYEN